MEAIQPAVVPGVLPILLRKLCPNSKLILKLKRVIRAEMKYIFRGIPINIELNGKMETGGVG